LRADRAWFCAPSRVTPPLPRTGYAHPKCYARQLLDCSAKISLEHVISNDVLQELKHDGKVKIANVRPRAWKVAERNSFALRGPKELRAPILCVRHNNALWAVDSAAGRLNRVLARFDTEMRAPAVAEEIVLFSGADIERWILKTAVGLAVAGQIPHQIDIETAVPMLFGESDFAPMRGLYFSTTAGERVYHSGSVGFDPLTDPRTNTIVAFRAIVRGFTFTLMLGRPDAPHAWGTYRPRTLVFRSADGIARKFLELSWPDPSLQGYVTFTCGGSYDGPPPDWEEWMKG
jgi:hypothetical protein